MTPASAPACARRGSGRPGRCRSAGPDPAGWAPWPGRSTACIPSADRWSGGSIPHRPCWREPTRRCTGHSGRERRTCSSRPLVPGPGPAGGLGEETDQHDFSPVFERSAERRLVTLIHRRAMRPARCSRQLGPAVRRMGSAGRGGMCRSRPWSSSTRTARIPSRRNSGIPCSRERRRMTRKCLRPPRRGIPNPDADAKCRSASSLRPGTRTGRPAAARSRRRACWPAMIFSAWLLA